MNGKNKVLILAPHTDDGELGCGASIRKWIDEGKEVIYVAFSACELSVAPHLPKDILITEVKAATQSLGIQKDNLILFNYPVRTFLNHRQEILQNMIDLRRDLQPDLILIPSLNDVHQDHQIIANEALRAFKTYSVLSYELPWNNLSFSTSCFVVLEEKYVEAKVQALQKYESQAHRAYTSRDFVFSLAKTRGVQINQEYAEAFEVVRWIW